MVAFDPEVVHPAGAAEAHVAASVEFVVAQAVVVLGVAVDGWGGFGGGAVRVAGCAPSKRAVRPSRQPASITPFKPEFSEHYNEQQ